MHSMFVRVRFVLYTSHAPVQTGSQMIPLVQNNIGKTFVPRLYEVVLVHQYPEARSQIPLVTVRVNFPQ